MARTDRAAIPASDANRSARAKTRRPASAPRTSRAASTPSIGDVADAALGHGDDAPHRDVVVLIHHGREVREHVLDLLALVEARAAHELVGDLGADEALLDRAGLGVGAVHDRDIGPARTCPVATSRLISSRDESRLVLLGVRDVARDALASAGVGPQVLGPALGVVRDHGVRGAQDRLRRAVVLLEVDDLRVGVVLLELVDVADVRAAERVDRLVGVTDHGELALGKVGSSAGPASSRTRMYCAWLVSWYSSTRMWRNRSR